MERASTRTAGNPVLLSLKAKTKGRRMLRNVVSTLFLQDLSVLGVKASVTRNISVLHISRALGRARHLLLQIGRASCRERV